MIVLLHSLYDRLYITAIAELLVKKVLRLINGYIGYCEICADSFTVVEIVWVTQFTGVIQTCP